MTDKQVVMAVRSDSFAGVEQYICGVSSELHRRGWQVSVIGGQPDRMRKELPSSVACQSAASTMEVVRALARHGRARLVHAHMTAAETAAVLTRPVTGARIVATRHFAAPRGSTPLARTCLRPLAAGIAAEIAISDFVASTLERAATVILNGVAGSDVVPDDRSRRILVMQRLEREKSTEVALQAWQLSGLAEQGWTLAIAGRGSQAEQLRRLAERLGVTRSVTFLGFVADPSRELARSAAFLATASAEPFGLAVVEAMAAGLPVVASSSGAHPETVGDTGLLFPPADAQACADHLVALAGRSELRRELGDRARERQRERMSLPVHVDRLERLYDSLGATW